jgi:predicted DNA-binding transcriptional regulator AlpA
MTNLQLYSVPEARRILGGISRSLIYELFKSGEIKVTKIGSRSFVAAAEIDRFVAARSEPARADA